MYNPRTVACKTVIVTEEEVCPDVTVTYLDTPEVTYVGSTATCRATLNTNDGNPPKDSYGGTAAMGYDGSNFVDITDQIDLSLAVQTINFTWEMDVPTVYMHMFVCLANSCSEGDIPGIQTQYYTWEEGAADITATDITATPSACEAPCDISVSITWQNIGNVAETFIPKYTINGVESAHTTQVTLHPSGSYVMTETLFNMPAGTHVICPVPN